MFNKKSESKFQKVLLNFIQSLGSRTFSKTDKIAVFHCY